MLTPKQERFCAEYKKSGSFLQAIKENGCELVNEPVKYFVYFLVNPLTDKIFYVGKGKGRRAYMHGTERDVNFKKKAEIEYIKSLGSIHSICYFECFDDEKDAYFLERQLIKEFKNTLTNIASGNFQLSSFEWARYRLPMIRKLSDYIKTHTPKDLEWYFYLVGTIVGLSENRVVPPINKVKYGK